MTGAVQQLLAQHQRQGIGMTSGSPDTCFCEARIMPDNDRGLGDDIRLRRDRSFASHQEDVLRTAGLLAGVTPIKVGDLARYVSDHPTRLARSAANDDETSVPWLYRTEHDALVIRLYDNNWVQLISLGAASSKDPWSARLENLQVTRRATYRDMP